MTCHAEFYNHDHGIARGTITVLAGSRFTATGPLTGTGAAPDPGGGAHLSSANPLAALKPITGWRMPAGTNGVDYIGDIQATECHAVYPGNTNNPTTQCTTAEPGTDSIVEYRAQVYEEDADGATCHLTDGAVVTRRSRPKSTTRCFTRRFARLTPQAARTSGTSRSRRAGRADAPSWSNPGPTDRAWSVRSDSGFALAAGSS